MHIACDNRARPMSIVLSAGQEHDSCYLEQTLDAVRVPRIGSGRKRKRPRTVVADKGYAYTKCRRTLRKRKVSAIIPERKDQIANRKKKGSSGGRPCQFDKELYRTRNLIERCFLRLKQWRRIAIRYDKRAASFHAWLLVASLLIWSK